MHVSSQGAPNVTPTPAHCANTSRSTPVKPCRHRTRSSYTIRWSRKLWMCVLACSISMAPLLQYRVQTIGVLPPSVRFIRRVLLHTLRKMNPVAEPYLWSSPADTAASASTTICTTTSSISRVFQATFNRVEQISSNERDDLHNFDQNGFPFTCMNSSGYSLSQDIQSGENRPPPCPVPVGIYERCLSQICSL